jgi:adenylate cyclase class 2
MYEIEVKLRTAHEPVRERLAEFDATRIGGVVQEDTYYDAPHRSFAETDEALRLRRTRPADESTWSTEITYKGPLLDEESKSREEHETGIDDWDTADAILEQLGFDAAATVRKDRTSFSLGDCTVTLDDVEGLGEFVEVETETESESIDAPRERVYDRVRDLGLDPDEQLRRSYLGLLLENE